MKEKQMKRKYKMKTEKLYNTTSVKEIINKKEKH